MPSPFPGMDPYLEDPDIWPDFHGAMIVAIRTALARELPAGYVVLIDRYVWLYEPDAETRLRFGRPDAALVSTEPRPGGGSISAIAELAPSSTMLPAERRQGSRFVKLMDRQYRRVVTVIELLSPSNKDTGEDRDTYLAKRNEYLATGTNLVEIDLLRAGERLPLGQPAPTPSDYYVLVSPGNEFPRTGLWTFSVRDALPTIPIPLNPGDGTVPVALAECMNRVYDEACYARALDYSRLPVPPLREPDALWARELLGALMPLRQ